MRIFGWEIRRVRSRTSAATLTVSILTQALTAVLVQSGKRVRVPATTFEMLDGAHLVLGAAKHENGDVTYWVERAEGYQ